MTPAMRDAMLELRRPLTETEQAIVRKRARLEHAGLLGLVASVAMEHGVAVDELLSTSIVRSHLHARRAACSLIRGTYRWSFGKLARVFEVRINTVRKCVQDFERSKEAGSAHAA